MRVSNHLVLVELVVDQLVLALLLERDNDQRHEDVDEEEREDDEVDDVEDGHLHAVAGLRAVVFDRRVHRVSQHAEEDTDAAAAFCSITIDTRIARS